MKKLQFLLILLVVGVLFVPAVSAEELIDSGVNSAVFTVSKSGNCATMSGQITFYNIAEWHGLESVYIKGDIHPDSVGLLKSNPSYSRAVTAKIGSTVIGTGEAGYNGFFDAAGNPTGVQCWVDFDTWDIGTRTGTQTIVLIPVSGTIFNGIEVLLPSSYVYTSKDAPAGFSYNGRLHSGTHIVRSSYYWKNAVEDTGESIVLTRNFDGTAYQSNLIVTYGATTITDGRAVNLEIPYAGSGTWNVTNPYGRTYSGILGSGSGTPQPPVVEPVYRTGTVTMTDHNGTTITGFEVMAINAYTDQSYNVSTDTDVAVMTLPMERTITIRNPQTGEYEDAPVGYYRFYGQAPGYKMLNEEGIRVSVMPEKYSSYQLCDIGVTSESGYLSGQHKFQIRSRADNSVLQTGTISAKSATTNEWYNTTVSGGIATLILPYDTSNTISQYAGNYYVYATSPGYEDSDYGTQIVVMPHTVSETRIILLTPIGGIPPAGNVTLRIQAFSEYGPGVPNASIFIAGVIGEGASVWDTYTASSTGYLTVSVPGNSTYDIVASAEGYYDSARRVEVFMEDPPLIEIKLYLSGAPTVEPTEQPTGWVTEQPTPQPTGGIPDEDDDSEGFLMQAVRGIGLAFGVGFATAKLIFGMLLALSIGYATAKQLRGGAAEFGLGLLGGTLLGVLIGLLPVWIIVVLLLVVGLYIGNRYVGGANNG